MKHEARILSSVLFIHWAMNWIPAASLYPVATDFIPNPRGPLLPSYLSHYKLYKPFIVVNKILRKVLSSVKWVLIFKFSNVSVREMAKCCKILCMNSCKFMDISSTHLKWTGSDIFVCERYQLNIPFGRRNTRFGVWGNKLRTKSRYL